MYGCEEDGEVLGSALLVGEEEAVDGARGCGGGGFPPFQREGKADGFAVGAQEVGWEGEGCVVYQELVDCVADFGGEIEEGQTFRCGCFWFCWRLPGFQCYGAGVS